MNRIELDIIHDVMESLRGGKKVLVFEKHPFTDEWQKIEGEFDIPYRRDFEFRGWGHVPNHGDPFENRVYADIDIPDPDNPGERVRQLVVTDRQYKPEDPENYECVWCTPEDEDFIKKMEELKGKMKEYKKKQLYLQEYKDYIGEDIVTKENWGDILTPKYYAVFNIEANDIIIMRDASYNISQGTIYSRSFNKIEKFIDKVGKDKFKKYILKIED